MHNLKATGTKVHLHWIVGHVTYKGNEQVDQAAKEAAQEATNWTCQKLQACQSENKMSHTKEYFWDISRVIHNIIPEIPSQIQISIAKER